jgi:RNA polymerase sigma factor (sigma-70 family)
MSTKKINQDTEPESISLNAGSFEGIYNKYWSEVYLYSYNVLRDREAAKDVAQEVFLSFLQKQEGLQIQNLRAFLLQCVKFQIYNLVRADQVKLRAFEQLNPIAFENSTVLKLEAKELDGQIREATHKLPEQCRVIFELKQDGHTAKINAEMTVLSHRTVETQIYLAVKKLRISLNHLLSVLVVIFLLP